MKTVSKLSLIALAVLAVGCNEKVSPELQSGNATTPTTSTPTAPNEFYFSVTNAADPLLNYKLHKTGAGNGNTPCEIRNTSGFSNDAYRGAPVQNDITCFMEAEELALWHGGLSFDINASKNTCDYVAYSPFSFYDMIPGDSTGVYTQVICTNPGTPASSIADGAFLAGINITDSMGNRPSCDGYIAHTSTVPAPQRLVFSKGSDEDFCAFNYPDYGLSCDEGIITVNELRVTYTPADETNPAQTTSTVVPRRINCGGKIANCVKGPIKEHNTSATSFTEIVNSTPNQEFKKNYEYDSPGTKGWQTLKGYVNYRRNLASKHVEFGTSAGLSGAYKAVWGDPVFGKTFDPEVMEYFSANMMFNLSSYIVTQSAVATESIRNRETRHVPAAADPFMGLWYNGVQMRVNPFYTFYCLDTAFDIKARIRMVIRDWDRVYPSSSGDLELLSDLFRGSASRQDIPLLPEVSGSLDFYSWFNDMGDWDDHIPMERTGTTFDPFTTIWRPAPTLYFSTGWFNPDYFTRTAL